VILVFKLSPKPHSGVILSFEFISSHLYSNQTTRSIEITIRIKRIKRKEIKINLHRNIIRSRLYQHWQHITKKRPERRKHCALAVVRRSQKLRPAADLFPGARDGQNLTSCRWSLPLRTNPVWWGSMHAISSYRGERPTHPQTHKIRQDRLQYTAPQCKCSQQKQHIEKKPKNRMLESQHHHIYCKYLWIGLWH